MNENAPFDAVWAQGPAELLAQALDVLAAGHTERSARIAYLLVDNCVEQALRTYLLLPARISGHRASRKRLAEAGSSFPALLDALEEIAPEVCEDLDLGAIQWLHQLRNELYHQGIGMTVRRANLELYLGHAALVLERLFGVQVPPSRLADLEVIGRVATLANRLVSALRYAASDHVLVAPRRVEHLLSFLRDVLGDDEVRLVRTFLRVRHKLLHAEDTVESLLSGTDLDRIEALVIDFEQIGDLGVGHEIRHGL
ncbi:MAG: hypothetical protein NXI30_12670 [bacterium]|nr:hypothetical protein [bacterium]